MTKHIRGPLSQMQYFSLGGGISESADPNDQDKSTGQTAGNVGTSDVMTGHASLSDTMGWGAKAAIGAPAAILDVVTGWMDKQGRATIAAGGPQEAPGASRGSGYGVNESISGHAEGASTAGNNDAAAPQPPAPTDPAAGATPSTRYIPGTGDYERILIRKDGTRTDLAGNPLAFAGGGATGGRSADGAPVSGLFAGGTPGRADLLDTMLPEDAYILPADTVSAAGEGNTEAGALSLARHFGQPLVKHTGLSTGPIRAKVSSGEFYVSPADVDKAGGADALDKMVRNLRKHYAKNLSALPGPKK